MNEKQMLDRERSAPEKIGWQVRDQVFTDGSRLSDWVSVESYPWLPQHDGHEMCFSIYKHAGFFWKLYKGRWSIGNSEIGSAYGGVACRVALVEYTRDTLSPHSGQQLVAGSREWVRVGEMNRNVHHLVCETVDQYDHQKEGEVWLPTQR